MLLFALATDHIFTFHATLVKAEPESGDILVAPQFLDNLDENGMPLRSLEDAEVVVIVEPSSSAETEKSKEKSTKEEEEDEDKLPDDLRTLTAYPEPLMTNEQVRHGGFFLYVFGKFNHLERSSLVFTFGN